MAQSMAVLPAPITTTSRPILIPRVKFALLDVAEAVEDVLLAGNVQSRRGTSRR